MISARYEGTRRGAVRLPVGAPYRAAQSRQAKGINVSHLQRRWFEIQVRSILDHAWSEIEHEVSEGSAFLERLCRQ
jgi:hypothetical protein